MSLLIVSVRQEDDMHILQQVESGFARIGAEINIQVFQRQTIPGHRRAPLSIDVSRTSRGEVFTIETADNVHLDVIDLRRREHHLLLRASNLVGEDRFLCGHDEQHWFVAALPARPLARNIEEAKQALKPKLVLAKERRRYRGKHARRSDVFLRQGEWFFIPWPHVGVQQEQIERGGSLKRAAGSKPHHCELLYRDGAREYECGRYPKLAFFEEEYLKILRTRRKAKQWNWRLLPYRGSTYVKGWVTHPDHSPLYLDIWHRVEMNSESNRLTMSNLVYLD
jgi:hypothetical protein